MENEYVKKTIMLNQNYINKALQIFNVKTEQEAVNRALEVIVEESEIIQVHDELGRIGEIEEEFK